MRHSWEVFGDGSGYRVHERNPRGSAVLAGGMLSMVWRRCVRAGNKAAFLVEGGTKDGDVQDTVRTLKGLQLQQYKSGALHSSTDISHR